MTIRIAMWSGPRNISTAMMRAFENRTDTQVVDEPFYAYYLHETGIEHPMASEIINSQSIDGVAIASALSSQAVSAEVYYQKHMTHHMLRGIDMSWTAELQNCFLIRDPRYVVNSYAKKRDTITQDDIGIRRQYELFLEITEITDREIPVVDARRFLMDPETSLRQLCAGFGVEFSSKMLSWPEGRRDSDGVWASHWYEAVEHSSGFQPFKDPVIHLTAQQQRVAEEADEYYQLLLEKCQFASRL